MKQAVATGWDCPRANILVKLRVNMNETFQIQTIGRIRRMPEAKHYNNEILDSCYIYTFDETFINNTKHEMNTEYDSKTIYLKDEYKNYKFTKEKKSMAYDKRDSKKALTALKEYLKQKYDLTNDKCKNKAKLEANGFIFSDRIIGYTISGKTINSEDLSKENNFNTVTYTEGINKNFHVFEYQNRVRKIGFEMGQDLSNINTIFGRLFCINYEYRDKLLSLTVKDMYAFVINNYDKLLEIASLSMAKEFSQMGMKLPEASTKEISFPNSMIFTYDKKNIDQSESKKNIYQGYLMSAEKRSDPEKLFERFCEDSDNIDWFYKNGDKGEEFLSILYYDNAVKQKLFYPDYIVSIKNEIWIIETKGGFTRTGQSEDMDEFTEKKFNVLKNYIDKYGLKGGIVRYDKNSQRLCICQNKYSQDLNPSNWKILNEVIK